MFFIASSKSFTALPQVVINDQALTTDLAQWARHYQAETVDLRYFFHSGWSS